ncbi:hypothetical protein GGU11DRAFT_512361 [Lentinula aff. detonsa]|nr:hypothetical protein GGU11DRAFT_512361 [Lentinula aff. detonsa]
MRRLCPGQSSVTQVIIRDGTVYFLVTVVLSASDLILLVMSMKSRDTNSLSQLIGPFFNVFSNLLISRLILNLHTFNTTGNMNSMNQGGTITQFSSLHFVSNRIENEDEVMEMEGSI